MTAAQLPTADHPFVAAQPSPELRAMALSMFGQPAPQRPAHLAAERSIRAAWGEIHAEQLAAGILCPLPDGKCWVRDREPGRHVAEDEPTEAELREAAESADAELAGEWAREGGGW